MNAPLLLGAETEYAVTPLDPDGRRLDLEEVVPAFMDHARKALVALPDMHSNGLFLGNGARLYIDRGLHVELSTAECDDPVDVVRHVLAGDRILVDLARGFVRESEAVSEFRITKHNVCYEPPDTWGSHESYLCRRDVDQMADQLVPHLVSRIVYAGAGGLSPHHAGIEFSLSPRASFLVRITSSDSTGSRGIVHTKNEPLADEKHRRLHLLCGESLCSETAAWLRFGVTALVVAQVDRGRSPARGVRLRRPLAALRDIARDPDCRCRVDTESGPMTAVRIQRHYLERVEEDVGRPGMPEWTGDVCRRWREILDGLEDDPGSMDRTLDWAIKRRLFETRMDGLDPSLRRDSSAALRRRWAELCEIDIRFGQLGPGGLFGILDRRGLLDHHVSRVRRIARAVRRPPGEGRARLRGRWIRRLAPDGGHADWMSIVDDKGARWLDLRDPFGREETWVSWSELGRRGEVMARLGMHDLLRAEALERRRAASGETER